MAVTVNNLRLLLILIFQIKRTLGNTKGKKYFYIHILYWWMLPLISIRNEFSNTLIVLPFSGKPLILGRNQKRKTFEWRLPESGVYGITKQKLFKFM